MEQWIKNFLLEDGNIYSILLVVAIFFIAAIAVIAYAFYRKRQFKKAWMSIVGALASELNAKGLKVVDSLMGIAMISADKKAALAIGMFKERVENNKNSPKFYSKLLEIIEGIDDNNHTKPLNSDYALARDSIANAVSLINDFSQSVGNFEDFANLSIVAHKVKKDIEQAVLNLEGTLYSFKLPKAPKEDVVESS
ncbi:MAG: hypothetical protein UR66_C0002G0122 [Candidatus Moranbacteria bacterium GW2011_GWE1_35_17]|nr:MAG: hypothetical protein UR65_C0070G0008 [Candidatus Moranbacteria bacterium GW2011_GWE2_35_164]KKP69065.1 MAG: hypothetical protein UR66_C0002G0122 [Candidatus Moranbacteria bacterium GW2011_GWE1_35_17]KKP81643.1 MAG: hypothetical protein UR83_C0070G0009 [Candidatus Moranbacteria bacterium GW2011_GWF2_35_54]KKP84499.1 MAG: hypothetical protein UR82_C0004G0015 [Candidatus Moranbacteria bacterium GW2011_GWF1_35_5]